MLLSWRMRPSAWRSKLLKESNEPFLFVEAEFDADNLLETIFKLEDESLKGSKHSKQSDKTDTGSVSSPRKQTMTKLKDSKHKSSNDFVDVEKLKRETERLRSNVTCRICLDATVHVLFLPCRHLICCEQCANNVHNCPLCRQRIVGTIKAFV